MKDIPISSEMEVAIPSSPKVGGCHPNFYGGGGHQSFVRRRWPPLSFREDGLPDVLYGEGDHLNIFEGGCDHPNVVSDGGGHPNLFSGGGGHPLLL